MSRLRREEFPVTSQKVWFDTATYGPLPVSNVRAQTTLLEGMMLGGDPPGLGHWWDGANEVRGKVGQFIGCDPADVALLRSTGEGISLVSLGLDWLPGDEVVLYDQEFPSDVYPFLALEKKGVKIVFVADRGRHRFDADDVAEVMSDRTRVVCISLVNCYHGFRAPVEQIAALCRQRGCWFLVDAVQGAGVLPVSVASLGADLVSAHGYKSMCSGYGISFCYVSPQLRDNLEVVAPGWKNIEDAPFIGKQLDYNLRYPASARRFEPTVQNLAGMYGLGASIDLFAAAGPAEIADWVLTLIASLTEALNEKGYRVVSSGRPGEVSGIISAEVPGGDPVLVRARLAEQNIRCAVRDGRLRFSCHLFNNRDDIERLIAALPPP
ncbi:MAG: aminotransferase class V-fold PLP-dependent enzyme [Streptosporangiaceae bacterium]